MTDQNDNAGGELDASPQAEMPQIPEPETYDCRMSENEFKIRQYTTNVRDSQLRGSAKLVKIRRCFDNELAWVDLDMTQAFKTGWLQPGHRMLKAFGFNPAGENNEQEQSLKAFLGWVSKQFEDVKCGDLDIQAIVGLWGLETDRGKFLTWLSQNKRDVTASQLRRVPDLPDDGSVPPETDVITEYLGGPKENKEYSPLWLEVFIGRTNPEDPQEVHDCETPSPEDPNVVTRCGFKQNDMGYFVLMPKLARFTRCVQGVFDPIEQRSYYPYYPFSERERDILLLGLSRVAEIVPKGQTLRLSPAEDEEPLTSEELARFTTDITNITDERGAQPVSPGFSYSLLENDNS